MHPPRLGRIQLLHDPISEELVAFKGEFQRLTAIHTKSKDNKYICERDLSAMMVLGLMLDTVACSDLGIAANTHISTLAPERLPRQKSLSSAAAARA